MRGVQLGSRGLYCEDDCLGLQHKVIGSYLNHRVNSRLEKVFYCVYSNFGTLYRDKDLSIEGIYQT